MGVGRRTLTIDVSTSGLCVYAVYPYNDTWCFWKLTSCFMQWTMYWMIVFS